MAPQDVLGSPQRSQSILWPVASNDHYCPDEPTCRHAVIDISSKDTRGPIHYLAEQMRAHSQCRDTQVDSSRAAYSDRRIVWSPPTHSEALMSSLNETSYQATTIDHEKEESKLARTFIKYLTYDSISTRSRLAFLESYAHSSVQDMTERCDQLVDLNSVLNEQMKLLSAQHNSLLDSLIKSGNELRLHAYVLNQFSDWMVLQRGPLCDTNRVEEPARAAREKTLHHEVAKGRYIVSEASDKPLNPLLVHREPISPPPERNESPREPFDNSKLSITAKCCNDSDTPSERCLKIRLTGHRGKKRNVSNGGDIAPRAPNQRQN